MRKYQDLISRMTLEEKAAFFSGKDFWQTQELPKAGVPSIFLSDGPTGVRKQAAAADHLGLNESLKSTCFPTAATMANTWNPVLGEEVGKTLGAEAVYQKVNVLLGPGINIKRSPLCGRNFEYFSEDPYLAGKMAAGFVRGLQSNGISACAKHFAANNQEVRRMVLDSVVDERTLRELYLTAFEIAVKEGGVKTVMSSYNKLNGVYANENPHLLKDILRGEWGFDGVVVTDWGGDNDRVDALACGNELEMPTCGGETNLDIIKAVREGRIPESVVDENLDRLLELIFSTEEAYKKPRVPFDVAAHHNVAERAAEEGIVLLKNEGGILPLAANAKVGFIGDFANISRIQGAGSSIVNPTKVDSTLDIIPSYPLDFVGYEPGFKRYGKKNGGLIKKALKLAQKVDVVLLYIGLDEQTETEGLDRTDMKLPANQVALIRALKGTGKKIVAVLSCGSAIETDWATDVDALVHAYLGGQAVATAVLNVLTGKVNPSGKLSESYPVTYQSCSSAAHFPGTQRTVEYREGLYVGYRYYDTAGVPVAYPFGFGLSYTTFAYADIAVTDTGVTFTVTNTGRVAGKEVAQVYIGLPGAKVFRPKKELKGFVKVDLEAGESKRVTVGFDGYTFRYYNVETNAWEIEPGTYTVSVGASSADTRLTASLAVAGTAAASPYDPAALPSYYSGNAADVPLAEFQTLYGKKVPDPSYQFIKKNRVKVDVNTAISELKYAPGWSGRFLAGALRLVYRLLCAVGKKDLGNVLMLGLFHMPLRGLSRMTGGMVCWGALGGLVVMFNGKFFKGLGIFFKEGGKRKKYLKAQKRAQKL
ncbi:MAG: glycoside hydrolase family 3 C-terminal domain-containing protein [Clostridiales bacterium]|jgi:beta-glucosidase|nr:glycoside hydrolase family 3 C-terminal domain-containing protein [Clostridiales bacterium]